MADNTLTDFSITTDDKEDRKMHILRDMACCFEEHRRRSYVDWPFQEPSKCTADAMAQAGFIHIPSEDYPDAVRCFFCCKELDGWEPNDDPWDEHVSHTQGKCQFLKVASTYENEITRKKFLELEVVRQKNITRAKYELLKRRLADQAAVVREKMNNLA